MDILVDDVKKVYFKYLAAAFGSTLISSIYGIVDMAMVGQYHGPEGSAALAVFAPLWNIIYSFGLLAGVGGSVLYSNERGKAGKDHEKANGYFTAAVLCGCGLTIVVWMMVLLWNEPFLRFFGADETLLPLAQQYLSPIKFVIPVFVFSQLLAAFLRNDGAPGLATAAVLLGGCFNVVGDWFFVFGVDMGILGAGLATAVGSCVSVLLMLTHFISRKNTLALVRPVQLGKKLKQIFITGFPTCVTDVAMGIMTILFNRQIMKYLGADALAVYAIIVNISTFVQCCAYSVGQASQPIVSLNFGAGKWERIRECLRYALCSTTVLGIFWTVLSVLAPVWYVHIFMSPTQAVLEIAPSIIRAYSLSFLLLPLNVFSTFYFQSMGEAGTAFLISTARGVVLSGLFILTLPLVCSPDSIWYAMLLTEAFVAVFVVWSMLRQARKNQMLQG